MQNEKTKKIYLVTEDGAGSIHRAFEFYNDAQDFVRKLEEETELECYKIIEVPFQHF